MIKKILLLALTAQILFSLPLIKEIKSADVIDGSVNYKKKLYFSITVPKDKSLEIKLNNLTADTDLYVAQDRIPRIRKNDCYSSNSKTADEECTINIRNNGIVPSKVNIMVYGFRTSKFDLIATIIEPQEIKKIYINEYSKNDISFNKSHDFKFEGKKNTSYRINLNIGRGDADLRIKVGKKANKHTFDCKSTKGGTQKDSCLITLKDDTTLYLNVFGYRSSNYKLNIKEYQKEPITLDQLKQMIANGEDVTLVNTSKITDMSELFKDTNNFNQNIGSWDVSNVTNMKGMFYYATKFNQSIENWNVSNVTDMQDMFHAAFSFNQALEKWNVSNVLNMTNMFQAIKFNQPLNNWNVSAVTDMSGMFNFSKFNQPLNSWNVSQVTDMGYMFFQTSKFNQSIEDWNVSNVTNMKYMFDGASSFKNQDLSKWNVQKVKKNTAFFTEIDNNNVSPEWVNFALPIK